MAKKLKKSRKATAQNAAAMAEVVRIANENAERLRDVIASIQRAGYRSNKAIAKELNRREIESPRGAKWYHASVRRLIERLSNSPGSHR